MSSEVYKGVELSSRHELAHEIAKMREIIDGIGPLSSRVESMWCDSKAGSTYSVTIRNGKWHDDLRRAIAESAFAAGGHNGIYVEADGGHGCTLDPDWPGDRMEMALMDAVEEMEAARLNQPHNEVIPKGFLDRLRTAIPLSEVVGRSTKWDLRKSNMSKGDYWAACPFHDDAGTGFHVDDRKGFYYCFGCHAKGDIVTFVKERDNVSFIQSVRRLAFIAGMDHELLPPKPEPPTILQLKDVIVRTFSKENFLEVGILTGWSNYIRTHDRLLRSLSWNDPDYAGNVLEMLGAMETKNDGSLEKVQIYVSTTFPEEAHIVTQTAAFSASKSVLGYQYIAPRNDIIAVMMPFQSSFGPVYEAIKGACEDTPLPAKRADEVWTHSTVISDILELINHAAVVVCDLTNRNENVFYELGIAHAWNKTVIPITQNAGDVPFDLQHHRYLKYHNNGEGLDVLRRELSKRLVGLVGKAPFEF